MTKFLCMLLLAPAFLPAFEKSALDLHPAETALAKLDAASGGSFGHRFLSTEYLEVTMMTGGAFTIGTSAGLSTRAFDDAQPLSFGHPYALTSYPLLYLDGEWKRFDRWTNNVQEFAPQKDDRLYVATNLPGIRIFYALAPAADGKTVIGLLEVENLGSQSRTVGLGLVFDPDLAGMDGYAFYKGALLERPTSISGAEGSLRLCERPAAPFGMQLEWIFDTPADQLLADNWPNMYADDSLLQPANPKAPFFDLCLKALWEPTTLSGGAKRSVSFRFELLTPDFSGKAFMRWDLPSALTLTNNLLFPRRMNTCVRVMNTSADALNNLQVSVNYPQELFGTESTLSFAVPSGASSFAALEVNSRVVYFDKIIPVKLKLYRDSETIDELTRYMFIPATPVSDVGLTVTIDSVDVAKHPQVSLIMRAEVTETGQRVLDLSAENIILYENNRVVEEFQLKKYESKSGGKVDVCFVLDISTSMGDEIAQVNRYIGEFADSLVRRGYDYQIALVCFSTGVDQRYAVDFTKDIKKLKQVLGSIELWGGIEDSPGAMQYALENYHWRPDSKRTIIWVTDEPYPENIHKRDPLINALLAKGVTVHGIGPLELQTDWFNPIVLATGGNFYNIQGNFRDILLDVARTKSLDRYLISYTSRISRSELKLLSIQVRWAGLGGQAQYTIGQGPGGGLLACRPNPFNPTVTLSIGVPNRRGLIEIFDLRGRLIRTFDVTPNGPTEWVWDAADAQGNIVSSGVYFVRLSLESPYGVERHQQRIVFLK